MKAFQISATVLATALLWGCASSPPPATDFPAGARTPSAAEVAAALGGKSFNVPGPRGMIRSDYAVQANGLAVFYPGGSDTGTWIALEKPGTMVAISTPMVVNRLAWIQWRRVQRPCGRCRFTAVSRSTPRRSRNCCLRPLPPP